MTSANFYFRSIGSSFRSCKSTTSKRESHLECYLVRVSNAWRRDILVNTGKYNYFSRNSQSKQSSKDSSEVRLFALNALRWIHLLESKMASFLSDVTLALKLSRLYCVFLAGATARTITEEACNEIVCFLFLFYRLWLVPRQPRVLVLVQHPQNLRQTCRFGPTQCRWKHPWFDVILRLVNHSHLFY